MKYTIQSPHFYENLDEDFKDAENILGYPIIPGSNETAINYDPRIFMCKYNQLPNEMSPQSCDIFSRSYTNEGLGFSFNNGQFWTRHKDTPYNK